MHFRFYFRFLTWTLLSNIAALSIIAPGKTKSANFHLLGNKKVACLQFYK